MYINVNDYKHLNCDSDMIQAAVDDASTTGQAVVIPKINARTGKNIWDITKTIVLCNDSILILQNCHLKMGDGVICKMFMNKNFDLPLIPENKQRNITIKGIGEALLDGGTHNGIYEKNGIVRKVPQKTEQIAVNNCMMYFKNVDNLTIEGLQIKNQRYWGLALSMVSYSRISNIRFSSESNVPNQDGVDILVGCHDIIIENISGCTGDNLIAICAITVTDNYDGLEKQSDGDIHNICVNNVTGYGVGGCALIRLLNHDGYKIYNISIDNVIETSPWSDDDACVAQNPDLVIQTDENGEIIPWRKLIPGEKGFRIEAAILIGESYWYNKSKAQPGDTFGISISNVMTHARYGIFINNTLLDSSFDNIRMFGNGFMAVYFGEGEVENLRFSNISYDKECKPLPDDEHVYIDWNKTKSDGFSCVYFNGMKLTNVVFDNMYCGKYKTSVFGGHGDGEVICRNLNQSEVEYFNDTKGVKVLQK